MPDHACKVYAAVQHDICDAFMVIAVYAECLAGVSLLVIINDQHPLTVCLGQDVRHADGGERLCNAAFQVNDRYGFHFDYPL